MNNLLNYIYCECVCIGRNGRITDTLKDNILFYNLKDTFEESVTNIYEEVKMFVPASLNKEPSEISAEFLRRFADHIVKIDKTVETCILITLYDRFRQDIYKAVTLFIMKEQKKGNVL